MRIMEGKKMLTLYQSLRETVSFSLTLLIKPIWGAERTSFCPRQNLVHCNMMGCSCNGNNWTMQSVIWPTLFWCCSLYPGEVSLCSAHSSLPTISYLQIIATWIPQSLKAVSIQPSPRTAWFTPSALWPWTCLYGDKLCQL